MEGLYLFPIVLESKLSSFGAFCCNQVGLRVKISLTDDKIRLI